MIHAVYRVYALEWEHTLPLISMHDVSMLPSCRTTILSAALSVFKSRAAEASEISTPFYVANHSSVVSHMQPQRRHSPSQYSGNAVSTSTQLLHSSAMHPPIHYTPTHSTSPPCPRLSTSHNPSPPPTQHSPDRCDTCTFPAVRMSYPPSQRGPRDPRDSMVLPLARLWRRSDWPGAVARRLYAARVLDAAAAVVVDGIGTGKWSSARGHVHACVLVRAIVAAPWRAARVPRVCRACVRRSRSVGGGGAGWDWTGKRTHAEMCMTAHATMAAQ